VTQTSRSREALDVAWQSPPCMYPLSDKYSCSCKNNSYESDTGHVIQAMVLCYSGPKLVLGIVCKKKRKNECNGCVMRPQLGQKSEALLGLLPYTDIGAWRWALIAAIRGR